MDEDIKLEEIIESFIGDRVMVVTKMLMITPDENGDMMEAPKVFYGELIAIDDQFVYIGDQEIPLILINIDEVRMIERDPNGLFSLEDELITSDPDGTIN